MRLLVNKPIDNCVRVQASHQQRATRKTAQILVLAIVILTLTIISINLIDYYTIIFEFVTC